MCQGDIVLLGVVGQIGEIAGVLAGQSFLGPADGVLGFDVKRRQIDLVERGSVVVANQTSQVGQSSHPLHALVGVGTVSNQIAQAPHCVNLPGSIQNGLQGG